MTIKSVTFAILLALPLSALAQGSRYYGVDNHASFTSACTVTITDDNGGTEKVYRIHGDQCGDASAHFNILFITGKITVAQNESVQAQEDDWISKVFARFSVPGVTTTATHGPADSYFSGVPERGEWTEFAGGGTKGLMAVYADNTVGGTIYITGWVIIRPQSTDPEELKTTAAIAEFQASVQIGNQ